MSGILRTLALACCAAGMSTCSNSPTEVVSVPGATVAGDTATFVTTSGAILSATVNPAGEPTTCCFEVGPTTAYGRQLGTHNVGHGYVPVTVLDTVTNLAQGTTYHFRVVASNVNGVTNGADGMFITPVDLAFPLVVGTSWTYHYMKSYSDPYLVMKTTGLHVWQVQSATGSSTYNTYLVTDVQHDTLSVLAKPDTTFTATTTFMIVEYADSIVFSPPEIPGGRWTPRFTRGTNDTLNLSYSGNPTYSDASVVVKGVGLVQYTSVNWTIDRTAIELTLVSFSKP